MLQLWAGGAKGEGAGGAVAGGGDRLWSDTWRLNSAHVQRFVLFLIYPVHMVFSAHTVQNSEKNYTCSFYLTSFFYKNLS
jgi:hypothetical protein